MLRDAEYGDHVGWFEVEDGIICDDLKCMLSPILPAGVSVALMI